MITYYNSDNTQTHLVGTKDDHITYLSVLHEKQIYIEGNSITLDIKYGPDFAHPHLTRCNSVPREIVYLLEHF